MVLHRALLLIALFAPGTRARILGFHVDDEQCFPSTQFNRTVRWNHDLDPRKTRRRDALPPPRLTQVMTKTCVDYLDMLSGWKERLRDTGLVLSVDTLPCVSAECYAIEHGGVLLHVYEHLLRIADEVVVMDYVRDAKAAVSYSGRGAAAVLNRSAALDSPVPVKLGLAIQDPDAPSTWWQVKDADELDALLSATLTLVEPFSAAFGGFAVFDTMTWRANTNRTPPSAGGRYGGRLSSWYIPDAAVTDGAARTAFVKWASANNVSTLYAQNFIDPRVPPVPRSAELFCELVREADAAGIHFHVCTTFTTLPRAAAASAPTDNMPPPSEATEVVDAGNRVVSVPPSEALLKPYERLGPRVCSVREDCACPEAPKLATDCLRRCIAQCHAAAPSGAVVLLPAGSRYITGSVNLTSFLTLRLEAGSELLGSLEPSDYPLVDALPSYGRTRDTRVPEAHVHVRHSALISGWGLRETAIEGSGTIDGRAYVYGRDGRSWYTRPRSYGRPHLVEPIYSTTFRMEGSAEGPLRVRNSAFWTVHPYACDGVLIRGLNITAQGDARSTHAASAAPNSDGVDPDSSSNVLIEDCYVDSGDDAVAIKSGMDYAGRRFARPSANITVRNCHFVQNAIAIGSEESGGVRNVTFENIVVGPRRLDHAYDGEGPFLHLKASRGRGGFVDGVTFRNISMRGPTKMAVLVSLHYDGPDVPTNASATPAFSNIIFEDVSVEAADAPGGFIGLPESWLKNVSLRRVRIGRTHGAWQCNFTSGLRAEDVEPPIACPSE